MPNSPRTGDGGARTVSRTQTLSPGGEPQLGRSRFSSPATALLEVAHPGTHPIHIPPPPMVAEVTLEENGYSRGRCPVRRFPWMVMIRKLLMFLTHNGNSPDNRLFAMCNVSRVEISPSSDGIGPVRLLLEIASSERLVRFPSSDGIDPVRLLLLRFSCERWDRFPSSGGSVPFSTGVPVWENDVTRCGVLDMKIPSQADIAVVAFQFRVLVPRRVSFNPQRVLQSAMSPVFVWSGTTAVVSHGCVVCPRASNNNVPEMKRSANSIVAAPAAMPHRMGRRDEGG